MEFPKNFRCPEDATGHGEEPAEDCSQNSQYRQQRQRSHPTNHYDRNEPFSLSYHSQPEAGRLDTAHGHILI